MTRWIAFTLLCAASCGAPPKILPPPFGQDRNARLFYPTGIAATPQGDLVVANANFDHTYDAGTMVTISRDLFIGQYAKARDCGHPTPGGDIDPQHAKFDPECDFQIPQERFTGKVLIGNYSGPMLLDLRSPPPGKIGLAYTGSRDNNSVNRVAVAADGTLSCPTGDATDCREASVDMLSKATLEGPYAMAAGVARVPGDTADRNVVFVAAMVPHIDEIISGQAYTSSTIAALDSADISNVQFSMLASSRFLNNGAGTGPMVFDPVRRQLYFAGCYQRYASSGAGDLTTSKCNTGQNLLRVMDVDAGAAAAPRTYDITSIVHATEISAMELGDLLSDGTRLLWATTRNADLLVEIAIPPNGLAFPSLVRAVTLPLTPAGLKVIPRPRAQYASDLVAVAASKTGSVMIYDPGLDQVVAQLERLGDTPWSLELLPTAPDGKAWLVASVFGSCRVAMMEIPFEQPWNALVRGRAGSCP